jgi:hypothetical protein
MKSKLSKKICFATLLFFASMSASFAMAPQWVECVEACKEAGGSFIPCYDFCRELFPPNP